MRRLRLRQLDAQLKRLKESLPAMPDQGWIRSLRSVLGMRATQLAQRLGITQPAVVQLEKGERSGSITLNSLRQVADRIDCELIYALVPRTSLETTLNNQARVVAEQTMRQVSNSMRLEEQATTARELTAQTEELVERLVRDLPRTLWEWNSKAND